MKIILLGFLSIIFFLNLNAQVIYNFTSGEGTVDNGFTVSQTKSSVTLTVSSGVDVDLSSSGNLYQLEGNAVRMNSASSSVTFTFSTAVSVTSITCADWDGAAAPGTTNFTFTPNTGASYQVAINGYDGQVVNLTPANFNNITSFQITKTAGGTFIYAYDNITKDTAFPVELTSFTGAAYGNIVALDWATATEVNNYGFEIECSVILSGAKKLNADGGTSATLSASWETLGFVQGHGNSNSPKSYSFEDKNPPVGKVQYRLKQIDFDGRFEYSPIVEVNVETPSQLMLEQNYPNPFNPETTINYQIPSASHVTLKVFDLLGNEVATLVDEYQQAGSYNSQISIRNFQLCSGVYFYKLQTNNRFSKTKKLMIIK